MAEVASIVADVRVRGDAALSEWSLRLDGVEPTRAVPGGDLPAEALLDLAGRVRRWHEAQRPPDLRLEVAAGVELERRWVPLGSVGIYIPRGLVSTVAMTAVPAQVAGVDRIVIVTPPAGSELVAAAADALGVAEVWAVGGAQAIAALAYGTETIPAVDKIVGPGNAYVNEAKLLVSRDVPIDLPAGPSEVLVVLGDGGDRRIAELEIAAQAEHGPDSVCEILEAADLDVALAEVERRAPEHVVLLGAAEALAPRVRNAGAVFVGSFSPVAAGDLGTGGNHVLPTGGRARSTGGLGLETFLKPVVVQRLTEEGLAELRPTVEALAEAESLPAHAEAVRR
ncbi:MAG TPA: histidinol dehydrogenase [Gaiellaceae bacterium]